MNRPELYHKTVDILFQAYFNDTLKHGNCSACAVGNICASSGYPFIPYGQPGYWLSVRRDSWSKIFMTDPGVGVQEFDKKYKKNERLKPVLEMISYTGYTVEQLAKIEAAFEKANKLQETDEEMFNGLCNVLEVLKKIHKVPDNTEDVQKFQHHYETLKH